MSYLTQLQSVGNALTQKRKIEYIHYNFGKFINPRLTKNTSVLEVGPGFGEFIEYCTEKKIKKIDIIENDNSVAKYIEKRYKVRKIFVTKNLLKISTKLDTYQVIMMTQVLEHIPVAEHKDIIRTLYSHLSPNGVLIITVPNIGNPLAVFERYYDYTHHTAFTEHSLEQMIDFSKLKGASVLLQPFSIPPIQQ